MIKNKPVIGIIPTYNITNPSNDPYLEQAKFVRMYSEHIKKCGGIPIGLLEENMDEYLSLCDGYLWPGGNVFLRSFCSVINDAIKNHKPVLGICLGMQAITTYFNILEDIENDPNKTIEEIYQSNKNEKPYLIPLKDKEKENHFHCITKDSESINSALHKINIEPNTILSNILKEKTIECVSLHSLTVARIPKSLKVSAKALDDVVEAIEYTENNNLILGVQWHPEIYNDDRLFMWLNESCKNNRK
jgi:gamma-glutamyl-gamma-aminobutyrate hydrolase PuuD